jgi:16S rRNA (guanine1516-N2)-methyltransferase
MSLVEGDSMAAMRALAGVMPEPAPAGGDMPEAGPLNVIASDAGPLNAVRPDVIYLDPMFPERQKSGLIKKKFQLLQRLESPCADEEELLSAALAARPLRIVIKRPLKGPPLAGATPSYSLKGKAIRYDCIVP